VPVIERANVFADSIQTVSVGATQISKIVWVNAKGEASIVGHIYYEASAPETENADP
jgi:hypothetical protein